MDKEIIIDVSSSHVEIALLENKRLSALNKDSDDLKFAVGDICLGKVKKIMPGLNAAFVDIGYEKDAFLHYLDLGPQFRTLDNYLKQASSSKNKKAIPLSKVSVEKDIFKDGKISDVLTPGQRILVQVSKEPISTKGPRLTSEISIAGRNMVLLPLNDKVSISQKLKSTEERIRLKKLIQSIKPKKFGVIVRTAAEGSRVAELDQEIRSLVAKWESIAPKLQKDPAPGLVAGELDRSLSMIRDIYNTEISSIHVNDKESSEAIKDYIATIAPDQLKSIKHYNGDVPIFEHFGINKQIQSSFGKTVSFRSGAYLVIEHTEAFHVIDVNSGNRAKAGNDQESNALEVNLLAAEEVARQLRLRDMGGIIVVDFIDMSDSANRKLVYDKLREEMSRDRTKHNILPLSKFCLMQITRQRVRPEMKVETEEICPVCNGTGEVGSTVIFVDQLQDRVEYILKDLERKKITLQVNPMVAAYLTKGLFSLRAKWSFKYGKSIKVESKPSFSLLEVKFIDKTGEEIIL